MTVDPVGQDFVSAPADYDALFRQYYGFVCGLVRKLGIDQQRCEDVACEILLRFYERDFLEKFDPDKYIEHGGVRRQARFKSFLSGFVSSYVRHHRERQALEKFREPAILDAPVGEDGVMTWGDVFGPMSLDDYSSVEEAELVGKIRAHLMSVPRRSRQDRCDLVRLFDLVLPQARATTSIDSKELMEAFGVSSTAIHSWLKLLREQVRVVVDEQGRE